MSELSQQALRAEALESLLVEKGLLSEAEIDQTIELYNERVGPINGAKMVARAWLDDGFRKHLLADGTVFGHVRPDDNRVWAGFHRLEHGHGGAHAIEAGDIAGGGYNAAVSAANDDRLVGKFGIVPFFDGGVKGVAIDMGDAEIIEFVMVDETRAAAGAAAGGDGAQ